MKRRFFSKPVYVLLMVVSTITLLSNVGGQPVTAKDSAPTAAFTLSAVQQSQCLDAGKARSAYHSQPKFRTLKIG